MDDVEGSRGNKIVTKPPRDGSNIAELPLVIRLFVITETGTSQHAVTSVHRHQHSSLDTLHYCISQLDHADVPVVEFLGQINNRSSSSSVRQFTIYADTDLHGIGQLSFYGFSVFQMPRVTMSSEQKMA